jgi:hypothetical protein
MKDQTVMRSLVELPGWLQAAGWGRSDLRGLWHNETYRRTDALPARMGATLRCAGCDMALIRITHIRGCYRLDLSGMSCLRIAADIH